MKKNSKLKKIISQVLILVLILAQFQMITPGKASAADFTPPTWSGSILTASGVTETSVDLSWTPPATDDIGVDTYVIYQNDVEVGSVSGFMNSYNVSALSPGMTYTFRVEARDAALNESSAGPTVTVNTLNPDITPPTWSGGSTLTASGVTETSVDLSWTPPATDDIGVDTYVIYQNDVEVGSVSGFMNSYNVSALSPGMTYTFRVEARDAALNESSAGPTVTVNTLNPDTTPPTVIGTHLTNGTSLSDGAVGVPVDAGLIVDFSEDIYEGPNYIVTLKTGNTVVDISYGLDGPLYIYPFSNLDYSTTYTLTIPAGAIQDFTGNTLTSDYTFQFTTAASPEIASTSPTANATGVNTGTGIDINFLNSIFPDINFGGISIIASDSTVVDYTYFTNANVLHLTPTGLQNDTTYTVSIPAGAVSYPDYSTNAAYSFSFTTEPAADVTPPTWSVSDLTYSNLSQTSVTISWPPASDNVEVSMYGIYQGGVLLGGNFAYNYPWNGSEYSYTITDLYPGQNYTFSVRAMDTSNNWSPSGPSVTVTTLTPPDTTAPTWPGGSTLTASGMTETGVNLSWTSAEDDAGVVSYVVYKNGISLDLVSGSVYSYGVTGLLPGATYTFSVEAVDAASNLSNTGPTVAVTTPDLTSPAWTVGEFTYSNLSSTGLTLLWPPADDNVEVVGYFVYKDGEHLDTVDSSHNFYDITGLISSTTYDFAIRASDAAGNFSPELSLNVTTSDNTPPTWSVSDLTYSDLSETSVIISWPPASDNVGVSRYAIYQNGVLIDENSAYNYYTGSEFSYTVNDLSSSQTYTFSVRAMDTSDNWSSSGPSVTVTTLTPPDATPPTWFSGATISEHVYDLTPDSFSATLAWPPADDPNGVVAYNVYQLTGFWSNGEFIQTAQPILLATIPAGSPLTYDFTGPSNVYNFKVEAVDANGNWSTDGPILYFIAPSLESDPPIINYTSPYNEQSGAPVDSDIMISFYDATPVVPGPNLAGISLKAGATVVDITYSFNSDGYLYIQPAQNLDYNTSYTVYLPTGSVQDLSGNPLTETTFQFTTMVSPEIIGTSPFAGDSGISPHPGTVIYIYFADYISPAANIEGISIKANAGTSSESNVPYTYYYDAGDLYLTPTGLQANTTYTVFIPAGAVTYQYYGTTNTAYSFSFTTEPAVYFSDANLEAAIRDPYYGLDIPAPEPITPGDLSSLDSFSAIESGIEDLTGLEYATNLTSLDLSYNNIKDLSPLSGLTGLMSLTLDGNQITDLSPLSGLTNLTTLWLSGNQIADISALSGLTNLSTVLLGMNQITDISPLVTNSQNGGLGNGSKVNLEYNLLDTTLGSPTYNAIQSLINSGAIVTYEPQINATDTTPPTWPVGSTLTVSGVTDSSLELIWTPATDDVGIYKYYVYQDGSMLGTAAGNLNTYHIPGLTPSTTYTFSVEALDEAGNVSTGPVVSATTPPKSTIPPSGPRLAYIPNFNSNSVTVVDLGNQSVVRTIYGFDHPWAVAVNPAGDKVYVTNTGNNSISVINPFSSTVANVIYGISSPLGAALNPEGTRLYVANYSDGTVSVINTSTNQLIGSPIPVGLSPRGIVVSPDGAKVYVANGGSNTVSIIDAATNEVISTVTVGTKPYGLDVTPDGSRVYVTNSDSSAVSVIETGNETVTHIPVEISNQAIVISPDGQKVYIANSITGKISIIDTSTNTVKGVVYAGTNPTGISISPGGGLLSVANYGSNDLSIFDAHSLTLIDTVPVGINPGAFGKFIKTFPPRRAYIPNNLDNTVSVIDAFTDGIDPIIDSIIVGPEPYGVAISPDMLRAYITSSGSNTLSIIDIETNKIITSVPVGYGPMGVAANPQGTRVYVANKSDNSISGINTSNNTVASTINLPENSNPQGIAVSPGGGRIYTANTGNNSVSILNTLNNTVENTVYGFNLPYSFAAVGDGSYVYVTNGGSNTVSMLDTRKQQVTDTINVGMNPRGIAVTPDRSKLYVANFSDNTVTVINSAYQLNNVINTIDVGLGPIGVAVTPDGKQVFVVNSGSNTVSVISTLDDTVMATINVGNNPTALGQFIGLGLKSHLIPPTVKNAVAYGNKLKLSYDRILDEVSAPLPSDYYVGVDSDPVTVTNVTVLGTRVDLTLSTPVSSGQFMTLDYIPGTNPVREIAGLPAAEFTGLTVWTDNPILKTAYGKDGGSQLTLSYNEPLNEKFVPSTADYRVIVDGIQAAVSSVQVMYTDVYVTINQPIYAGQDVRIDYTPSTNPLRDTMGILAAPLTAYPVDIYAPADITPPIVTYTDPLDNPINVPVTQTISVAFSEPIGQGPDFNGISIMAGDSVVDYTYTLSSDTLYLTPSMDLSYSTNYIVYLPAGAVQDMEGNVISSVYSFSFTTIKSANTDLSDLAVNSGALEPIFNSDTLYYTVNVPNTVSSIDVTPTLADSSAYVTVNGMPTSNGAASTVTLEPGYNTLNIVTTAQNGDIKTYTLTIYREYSANADLSDLAVNFGTLDPIFNPNTLDYEVYVTNLNSIEVTPTLADSTASVMVNDNAASSGTPVVIPLAVGYNTIDIVITTQNNYTKTYTLTVYRASDNADLATLEVYNGAFAKFFDPVTVNSEVYVGSGATDLSIFPLPADYNATVTVGGLPTDSGSVQTIILDPGVNTIPIIVTAENMSIQKTYVLTVYKAAGSVPFIDYNLQTAVSKALGKPMDSITAADMANLTVLNAVYSFISDLSGLEYAVHLKKLYLGYNQISDLSPLADLTSLEELWLDHNKIENNIEDDGTLANLWNLTNLKWLYLNNNYINSIASLANLQKLQALDLNNNYIYDVSHLGGLTSLWGLGLANNNITNISGLSTLINLQSLDLQAQAQYEYPYQNQYQSTVPELTDISAVANMKYLRNLLLNDNNITNLTPLQGLKNLKLLTLWNNGIDDITPLSGLSGLTDLWLDHNYVSNLAPLKGLTNLQVLSLAGNYYITNITSLKDNTGLGNGDYVYLPSGISSADAQSDIQTLLKRSVNVIQR